jgi:hypothetical protein
MTRDEVIAELKQCERRLMQLNEAYQRSGKIGNKPSEVDPACCRRRQELREMLRQRTYEGGES